jgi:hypothetical protein
MVTNYPRVASHEGLHAAREAGAEGLSGRALHWLRQTLCGLHGHDTLLRFEHERLSLRCASCGHETPGWELNEVPPTITVRGDARRHAIARPQLVSARRIA